MAKLTRIKPFVSDDLKLVYDTIPLLLDASPREEALCEVKGYHAAGDGGAATWVRDKTLDGGVFNNITYKDGKVYICNNKGEAYRLVADYEVDLRQLGAKEDVYIDDVFSLATSLCKGSKVSKINVYGHYLHINPLVIPAGVFVDYIDPHYSSTTKVTNNTSNLPALEDSYGGRLEMDVDACIILDHGYGHKLDNFHIKCDASISVDHAIYHGFTREVSIGATRGIIGDPGDSLKYKPMYGITAQQGFFHDYGYIRAYTQKGTWNYKLNTNKTGCNAIRIKQSWNYDSKETAIRFQAATNISLGQQYCEGTTQRIYEFTGCTGGTIDILSIDNHVCNQVASALYTRNSQITIGAMTVNSVTVAPSVVAKFIEHTVGEGIYGCLTINAITAQTRQINTPNLITITKDRGGSGNNCVIRGMPIPPIGASGNEAAIDAGSVSHYDDTGKATTPHLKVVQASFQSQAKGVRSSTIDCFCCSADQEGSTVLSSTLTKPGEKYEICGGYGGTSTGEPVASNRKWSISSSSGNIKVAGTVQGGQVFSDYAEYFENLENMVIPLGTLVDLQGDKVTVANGDFIGVVSGTAGVALNAASLSWGNMYLSGEHGEPIYEEVDGVLTRKLNPEFDADREYVARESRPHEWTCVGLVGQVYVNVADDVVVGDYLTALNGVGVKSDAKTKLRVMRLSSKGIAYCLLG